MADQTYELFDLKEALTAAGFPGSPAANTPLSVALDPAKAGRYAVLDSHLLGLLVGTEQPSGIETAATGSLIRPLRRYRCSR